MNYLAAIGIETWRNTRVLSGAKKEVLATVMEFVDEQRLVIRVVYPTQLSQSAKLLLNNFWQAIENTLHCKRKAQLLKSVESFNLSPVLVLSEDLGVLIQEQGLILDSTQDTLAICADPETVSNDPSLKKTWWDFVVKLRNRN